MTAIGYLDEVPGGELHGSDFAPTVVSSTPVSPHTQVEVNIRVLSAFEAETQVVLAPQQTERDDRPVVATRVIPTTTSCISPGLSVSVPR
ncbi:MAG: hypothetical protein HYX34_02650 [Actinobacteria bacterium]|nr:hypothetical protein [Actinomycetota bacterium]